MTVSHPGYYKHEVELIPGRGHSIDYSVTTPWLKTNVRDPHVTRGSHGKILKWMAHIATDLPIFMWRSDLIQMIPHVQYMI